jgi:hypothetical protein
MSRISTSLNRFYTALEPSYGAVPAIDGNCAFRALTVDLEPVQQYLERQDKSGSRTFAGIVAGGRRSAKFDVEAYLMSGGIAGPPPGAGPLFEAACGDAPAAFGGGTAAANCTPSRIVFTSPHGLGIGQAIGNNGELRFVVEVPDDNTVVVSPPFNSAPAASSAVTATVAYPLAGSLPSFSLFEYWDPPSAQQRILAGGAVNALEVRVQGDFHTVKCSGEGQDIIDSITFSAGQGGLAQFPAEPASRSYRGDPIAGHFGQVWLGAAPDRFQTLVSALLRLENSIALRNNEFGSAVPLGIAAGVRRVTFDFDLFQTDEAATQALYAAARNRSPVIAFLQLGVLPGHMFGAYMKSLVPQPPRTDARDPELKWSFSGARAAGTAEDELWIAFG